MSKLIVSQDNKKIVLVDGTTIEIDTGMFDGPLGFIVTEAAQQMREPGSPTGECPKCHNFGGTHFSLCPLANTARRSRKR
jgi:hypothetical protein